MSESFHEIPKFCWNRKLNTPDPKKSVHTFSRPPIMEALRYGVFIDRRSPSTSFPLSPSLLPVAFRVMSYLATERKNGREPIFDMNGLMLEPPTPGPYAGVPLGGIGGGSICRGFRGDFRRWSLFPGKYVHKVVQTDQFSIRIRRGENIYSQVLSIFDGTDSGDLKEWKWSVPAERVEYFALFPRAWSVFTDPVPRINIIIRQVSPVIPHNYADTCLPTAVFHVEVENLSEDAEVSVMFSFQNGYGLPEDSEGGLVHSPFEILVDNRDKDNELKPVKSFENLPSADQEDHPPAAANIAPVAPVKKSVMRNSVTGVIMAHHHRTEIVSEGLSRGSPATMGSDRDDRTPTPTAANYGWCGQQQAEPRDTVIDNGSFAIASCVDCSLLGGGSLSSPTNAQSLGQNKGHHRRNHSHQSNLHSLGDKPVPNETVLEPVEITTCPMFVVSGPAGADFTSAGKVWESFTASGSLEDCYKPPVKKDAHGRFTSTFVPAKGLRSQAGCTVAAAVCQKRMVPFGEKKTFSFSLCWDFPIARFGSGKYVTRYFTQFFGRNGTVSPSIAAFALQNCLRWEQEIYRWQLPINGDDAYPDFYRHMLFNELYFLVDGGSVWSLGGIEEQMHNPVWQPTLSQRRNFLREETGTEADSFRDTEPTARSASISGVLIESGREDSISQSGTQPVTQLQLNYAITRQAVLPTLINSMRAHNESLALQLQPIIAKRVSRNLAPIQRTHQQNIQNIGRGGGRVGKFLYYEGHEYLMYNTYDVHHYAGFALLMLWPHLELAVQRDFAAAVDQDDLSERTMLGTGETRPRKVVGAVPHDLGSPSESPWEKTNIYNFQDVSRWKDLGPKFVLQVYRDYRWTGHAGEVFLAQIYPAALSAMRHTLQFDMNGDGMIENQGFPDQTYDIWAATGVHAYCGGLWVAACSAMAAMAEVVDDVAVAAEFKSLAIQSTKIYNEELWNGEYFNLDDSDSEYHDSIMADMLAGHFFAVACGLPPVVSPARAFSSYKCIFQANVIAFGEGKLLGAVNGMRPGNPARVDNFCLQSREVWTGTTYTVAAGMIVEAVYRQDPYTLLQKAEFHGPESRLNPDEIPVSTPYNSSPVPKPNNLSPGTTALARKSRASLSLSTNSLSTPRRQVIYCSCEHIFEANNKSVDNSGSGSSPASNHSSSSPRKPILDLESRKELIRMAMTTAQGIHDGGWQEFGYWFATPEGWEKTGNYRSLGYMRPLSIWSIQFALENKIQPLCPNCKLPLDNIPLK